VVVFQRDSSPRNAKTLRQEMKLLGFGKEPLNFYALPRNLPSKFPHIHARFHIPVFASPKATNALCSFGFRRVLLPFSLSVCLMVLPVMPRGTDEQAHHSLTAVICTERRLRPASSFRPCLPPRMRPDTPQPFPSPGKRHFHPIE